MFNYELKPSVAKKLGKLPKNVQAQIINKLDYIVASDFPLQYAHKLKDFEGGTYRIRIGDYRVVFDLKDQTLMIVDVDHRKNIYR